MQDKINLIKETLKEDLKVSGWDEILNPFLDSKGFDSITDTLIRLVEQDRRFTPKLKDAFNAFKETNLSDLKVVIVGQDPYPQLGVADGIAFSCSKKGKPQPSLRYILKELGDEDGDVDLRRWANQGVLLINTAQTCEVNKIGSHFGLWKSFTEYIFESINKIDKNIIFVLMGRKAEAWQSAMPGQKLLKCAHPAAAAYNGGTWKADGIFEKVNNELDKQGKTCITW
mgnify:FL=1|tara:strand:+ start:405 stop:1085 length:681 start_codon:yes stop_codon:yes gene_type:complete